MDMAKPKIRFKGYTDDWEQRKLRNLVDRVTRKNQDLVSELPLTISAQYGLIDQNEFFDKRVASKDVSGYYLIENGEFAYNRSTSTDAPWGAIKRLDRYENGVLSTLYIVFRIKENNPVDSDFLVSYYSTNLWHKGIHEIAAEGARNHGLLNIAPADFFETELRIPQDIEEQKKIGKYFEKLERLITLHQRKCEETKKLKKYMLQKMFPQNGQTVPEIRFAGFTDAWEQRKFSEFVKNVAVRNKAGVELECYAVTNDRGFISQKEAHDDFGYMAEVDTTAYNIVPPSSFAYNPARINVGSIGYYTGTENVIVSSLYEVFQTADYVDDRFMWHWFKSDHFPKWIERLQEGSVRLYFYYDKLIQCEMKMPSLEEQKKMGAFFDQLDCLITLHQCKCHLLLKLLHNDWEQRKLSDVVDSVDTGKSKFDKEGSSGEYPILGSTSVIGYDDEYDYEGDFILTARVGANAGSLYRHAGKVKISDNTVFIQASQNIEFLYQLLTRFDIKKLSFGTGQPLVKASELKSLELMMPTNMKEQMRIGAYFNQLDHLITLHHRKYTDTLKSP